MHRVAAIVVGVDHFGGAPGEAAGLAAEEGDGPAAAVADLVDLAVEVLVVEVRVEAGNSRCRISGLILK